MTLLGGDTGDVARAARLRRRSRDLLIASGLLAAVGVALAAGGHAQDAIAVLAATLAGAAAAGLLRSERRRELSLLVAAGRGDAPEARAFAAELLSPARRRRLAEGLRRAARAGEPGLHELTHVRPERAYALHDELVELAAALADESRELRPESAALCRRLLCEPTRSPLYNASLPFEELERTLLEIRAGIGRAPAPAAAPAGVDVPRHDVQNR
jgi:hypothetical protein